MGGGWAWAPVVPTLGPDLLGVVVKRGGVGGAGGGGALESGRRERCRPGRGAQAKKQRG